MKPCTECRIYNTNNAKVCHQCGTPFPKTGDKWSIIFKAGTAVLVAVVLALGFYAGRVSSQKSSQSAQKPASLELISSEGFPTISGKMLVEGKVKNISGVDLRKTYVMISWFDKDGKKLESGSAPISANPLLNRRNASFRIVMPKNPKMENYEMSFFDASGNTLQVIDNR